MRIFFRRSSSYFVLLFCKIAKENAQNAPNARFKSVLLTSECRKWGGYFAARFPPRFAPPPPPRPLPVTPPKPAPMPGWASSPPSMRIGFVAPWICLTAEPPPNVCIDSMLPEVATFA
jgi:hypothetical protein